MSQSDYSVSMSHLVPFLKNSQLCSVLLALAASTAPPLLLGLFSNQINHLYFPPGARASFLHSVTPFKKINEVFHLLFFSIWNYFIIDRCIVCFCEYAVLPKTIFVYLFMHLLWWKALAEVLINEVWEYWGIRYNFDANLDVIYWKFHILVAIDFCLIQTSHHCLLQCSISLLVFMRITWIIGV